MDTGLKNKISNDIRGVRSRIEQCLIGKLADLKYTTETLTSIIEELENEKLQEQKIYEKEIAELMRLKEKYEGYK